MSKARDLADFQGSASALTTGTLPVDRVPYVGRRNILINGDFQVSQRGDYTTSTTTTGYLVDRWKMLRSTVSGSSTHYKNQTVNGELMDTLKHESTATATGRVHIRQYIEAVGSKHQYAGKTLTYSVWMRANSTNARILIYDYGVGAYIGTSVAHSGNGQWEKLTMTVTCGTGDVITSGYGLEINASITGATNGTIPISSGDYIEIAQPQLELGSVATPFEHRSYGEELALCKRYYEKSYAQGTAVGTNTYVNASMNDTSGAAMVQCSFQVEKRAVPTMVFYSPPTGNSGVIGYKNTIGSTPVGDVSINATWISTSRVQVDSSPGDAYITMAHWAADAEL